MERRSFVKGAGMAGILGAGVAPAVHAQQAVRWRLTSSFPKSLDTLYGGAELFATRFELPAEGAALAAGRPANAQPQYGPDSGIRMTSISF